MARTRSKIGEIVETETRPDAEPERRTVGSLFKVGDGIYHCSVEKPIHQEWLNEFVETVSGRKWSRQSKAVEVEVEVAKWLEPWSRSRNLEVPSSNHLVPGFFSHLNGEVITFLERGAPLLFSFDSLSCVG